MSILMHSAITATALAATVAVAFAGVALYDAVPGGAAAKSDQLPIASEVPAGMHYVTIEKRGQQLSVLERVPVGTTASK